MGAGTLWIFARGPGAPEVFRESGPYRKKEGMQAHANLASITLLPLPPAAARPTLFAGALTPATMVERAIAMTLLLATAAPVAVLGWIFLG